AETTPAETTPAETTPVSGEVSVSVSVSASASASASKEVSVSVSISNVVSVSISNVVSVSISAVDGSEVTIPVISEVTVISVSVSVSVSEKVVYVTGDQTTPAETTPVVSGKVSISIDTSEIDTDGSNLQWYYADEKEFVIDGIKVYVDGVEVDAEGLITFDTTPESTYDKTTFDYVVPFTVTVGDQTAEGSIKAKIGQRGDANCDHKVNAQDAAYIANNLAQLDDSKKVILTKEDGFGVFLGNSDEGMKNGKFAPYDLAAKDAATLANFLARSAFEKDLTLYDVAVLNK
ncbi:MAG: hypothetical protein K2F60_02460, partial [Oscillospiraceae bacterium]|nr:hypothetical protein [Oscillospiraceae bacterium]